MGYFVEFFQPSLHLFKNIWDGADSEKRVNPCNGCKGNPYPSPDFVETSKGGKNLLHLFGNLGDIGVQDRIDSDSQTSENIGIEKTDDLHRFFYVRSKVAHDEDIAGRVLYNIRPSEGKV